MRIIIPLSKIIIVIFIITAVHSCKTLDFFNKKTILNMNTKESVLRLSNLEGTLFGTGFVINYNENNFVITNAHVCYGSEKYLNTKLYPNKIQYLKILKQSDIYDLCILTPVKGIKPLRLARNIPHINQKIHTFGFPESITMKYHTGYISLLYTQTLEVPRFKEDCGYGAYSHSQNKDGYTCLLTQKVYLTTVYAAPGASGSPALNNNGEVIGVVTSSLSNMACIVPLYILHQFLFDFSFNKDKQ